MNFFEGLLYLRSPYPVPSVELELFNNQRTYNNMVAAKAVGALPSNFVLEGFGNCSCWIYPEAPADDPWYSAAVPESEDFLGFWVFSVTGFDGRHNQRTTTPRVSYPHGSILSPLRPTHRTLAFEVALVATSTCGLDYGLKWLQRKLSLNCGAPCALGEIRGYSCCPGVGEGDADRAYVLLKEVGLAEGPELGEPLTPHTAGYVRPVTLALYAGNPCIYGSRDTCLALEPLVVGEALCCSIVNPSPATEIMPIITIGTNTDPSPHIRIEAFVNPVGDCVDCAGFAGPDMWIDISPIPASSTFTVDVSTRRVWLNGPETGGVTIDGSAHIDIANGFIQWGNIGCADDICIRVTELDGVAEDDPPDITIESVTRSGC